MTKFTTQGKTSTLVRKFEALFNYLKLDGALWVLSTRNYSILEIWKIFIGPLIKIRWSYSLEKFWSYVKSKFSNIFSYRKVMYKQAQRLLF